MVDLGQLGHCVQLLFNDLFNLFYDNRLCGFAPQLLETLRNGLPTDANRFGSFALGCALLVN